LKTEDGGTLRLDWVNEEASTNKGKGKDAKPSSGTAVTTEKTGANTTTNTKAESDDTRPVVLLLPGFENSCRSGYIRRVLKQLMGKGLRLTVLNFRGYGNLKLTSPRYHNVADCNDLHFVVEHLRARYPKAPLIAAGFSMGAILSSKPNQFFLSAVILLTFKRILSAVC
jgi:predicted alpha/beta-fold hydrolase